MHFIFLLLMLLPVPVLAATNAESAAGGAASVAAIGGAALAVRKRQLKKRAALEAQGLGDSEAAKNAREQRRLRELAERVVKGHFPELEPEDHRFQVEVQNLLRRGVK
jgi:hypothetical protein